MDLVESRGVRSRIPKFVPVDLFVPVESRGVPLVDPLTRDAPQIAPVHLFILRVDPAPLSSRRHRLSATASPPSSPRAASTSVKRRKFGIRRDEEDTMRRRALPEAIEMATEHSSWCSWTTSLFFGVSRNALFCRSWLPVSGELKGLNFIFLLFKELSLKSISSLLPGTVSHPPQVQYSPGGLIFKAGGSNMQHVTYLSFLLLAYSNYLSHANHVVPCTHTSACSAQAIGQASGFSPPPAPVTRLLAAASTDVEDLEKRVASLRRI